MSRPFGSYLRVVWVSLSLSVVISSSVSAAQIKLTWEPNTEPDLAGYYVYYGEAAPSTYGKPVKIIGNNPNYTLGNVVLGRRYFFAVKAYDSAGNEGHFSDEVSAVVQSYTVNSTPPDSEIAVDGVTYKLPETFYWIVGSQHTIDVPSPQEKTTGKRYVFNLWSNGGGTSGTVTVPSSKTVDTVLLTTQYLLTTSTNIGEAGTISPAGSFWHDKGEMVPISAAANPGQKFRYWSFGAGVISSKSTASINMKGPKKIVAVFVLEHYSLGIKVTPRGSGSVPKIPSKISYIYGEQVSLEAKPKPGYLFTGWGGDLTGTQNPVTVTMDGNKSIVANFAKIGQVTQPSLIGKLESPTDGETVSGTRPIFGWALDRGGISRIELLVDGHSIGEIPYGGTRLDIKEAYPDYSGGERSGFAWPFDYSALSPGEHSIQVRAYNRRGEALDLGAGILVKKFYDEGVVDISPGAGQLSGVKATVDGITEPYDVVLLWSQESQEFRIEEIKPASGRQEILSVPLSDPRITPLPLPGEVQSLPPKIVMAPSQVYLPLIGSLESPAMGSKVSGVRTIHGWALDEKGISRIELFVDGKYYCDVPYGGTRRDIEKAYLLYPEAGRSGFALLYNFSALPAGDHTLLLKVFNSEDEVIDLAADVVLEKFHGDVVTHIEPDKVWFPGVSVNGTGDTFDLELAWSLQYQSFEISGILPR